MTDNQERKLRLFLVIITLILVGMTLFSRKDIKDVMLNKPAPTTTLPTVEQVRDSNKDSIELNRKIDSVMKELKGH